MRIHLFCQFGSQAFEFQLFFLLLFGEPSDLQVFFLQLSLQFCISDQKFSKIVHPLLAVLCVLDFVFYLKLDPGIILLENFKFWNIRVALQCTHIVPVSHVLRSKLAYEIKSKF